MEQVEQQSSRAERALARKEYVAAWKRANKEKCRAHCKKYDAKAVAKEKRRVRDRETRAEAKRALAVASESAPDVEQRAQPARAPPKPRRPAPEIVRAAVLADEQARAQRVEAQESAQAEARRFKRLQRDYITRVNRTGQKVSAASVEKYKIRFDKSTEAWVAK